jgi:hypothetical protein
VEDLRAFLSIVSGTVSAVLFVAAVWRSFRKSESASRKISGSVSLSVYGVLFLLAGAMLWQRGGAEITDQAAANRIPSVSAQQKVTVTDAPVPKVDESAVSGQSPALQPSISTDRLKDASTQALRTRKARVTPKPQSSDSAAAATPIRLPVEFRIYRTVDAVFTHIERWFLRHGSESPAVRETSLDSRVRNVEVASSQYCFHSKA